MDGSNRQNDNYDDNKYRYHGRRRNAYANLKLHKNPRANDDYSGESTACMHISKNIFYFIDFVEKVLFS